MHTTTRTRIRALALLTSVAVAGSTTVALAPSASAFYGSETTVRNAVLTVPEIVRAVNWQGAALSGTLKQQDRLDWSQAIRAAVLTDADAAPEQVELLVAGSPQERDFFFDFVKPLFVDAADSVSTNTGSVLTLDAYAVATRSEPAKYESVSLRKAGNDAIALTICQSTPTTTTTAASRAACSNALGVAQAASWTAVSPKLVWRSTGAVKAKMVSAAAARKAVKAPKGTRTKVVGTRSGKVFENGRQVLRKFSTSGPKLTTTRFAAPRYAGVTQYGNRLNAGVAFRHGRTGDVRASDFHTLGTDHRYTTSYTVRDKKKKVTAHMAATVILYSDVIVIGVCRGNDAKLPKNRATRTCSKRLAKAQLTKVRPLFTGIR